MTPLRLGVLVLVLLSSCPLEDSRTARLAEGAFVGMKDIDPQSGA